MFLLPVKDYLEAYLPNNVDVDSDKSSRMIALYKVTLDNLPSVADDGLEIAGQQSDLSL